MNNDPTLRSLLSRALDDITALVRGELRLAQAEMTAKVKTAQAHVVGMIAGMLLGFCGLLTLIQAVVIGLSQVMPAWLASSLTGLVLVGIALLLIKKNQADLEAANFKPRRTLRSVEKDKQVVMEHAS